MRICDTLSAEMTLTARIARVGSDAKVRSDLMSGRTAAEALDILRVKESALSD